MRWICRKIRQCARTLDVCLNRNIVVFHPRKVITAVARKSRKPLLTCRCTNKAQFLSEIKYTVRNILRITYFNDSLKTVRTNGKIWMNYISRNFIHDLNTVHFSWDNDKKIYQVFYERKFQNHVHHFKSLTIHFYCKVKNSRL